MTKVTISEEAQSDSRAQFIKDFNMAFAENNTEFILNCFTEDAHWEMVGAEAWDGREAIEQTLKTMTDGEAAELVMHGIVSDGNKCAANGVLKYDGGRDVAYCDVYVFTGEGADAKIKTLTAYAIEIES